KKVRVCLPKRVEIWRPRWEPEIKFWSLAYIRKNKWRYEYTHDVDDLIQDAYVVFMKVAEAYPRCVQPGHFMALYKTSLRNMLWDKSREYERKLHLIDEHMEVDFAQTGDCDTPDPLSNLGEVAALIASGPPEIRMFMSFIQNDENLLKLREPQRSKRGEPRLNFDQRVAKMLGIEKYPFRDTIRQLLS